MAGKIMGQPTNAIGTVLPTKGSVLPGDRALLSERGSGEENCARQVRCSDEIGRRRPAAEGWESVLADECHSDGGPGFGNPDQSVTCMFL